MHALYAVVGLFTCGAGWIVWAVHWWFAQSKSKATTVVQALPPVQYGPPTAPPYGVPGQPPFPPPAPYGPDHHVTPPGQTHYQPPTDPTRQL